MTAYEPKWSHRRRVVFGTLLFCAAVLAYIVYVDSGSQLHVTVAQGLLVLSGWVIGSYVFGAVYEDTRMVLFAKQSEQRKD